MNTAKRFNCTRNDKNPITHEVFYYKGNKSLGMLASFQTDEQIINAALDSCKYDALVKDKYDTINIKRKTGRKDSDGKNIWINIFAAAV